MLPSLFSTAPGAPAAWTPAAGGPPAPPQGGAPASSSFGDLLAATIDAPPEPDAVPGTAPEDGGASRALADLWLSLLAGTPAESAASDESADPANPADSAASVAAQADDDEEHAEAAAVDAAAMLLAVPAPAVATPPAEPGATADAGRAVAAHAAANAVEQIALAGEAAPPVQGEPVPADAPEIPADIRASRADAAEPRATETPVQQGTPVPAERGADAPPQSARTESPLPQTAPVNAEATTTDPADEPTLEGQPRTTELRDRSAVRAPREQARPDVTPASQPPQESAATAAAAPAEPNAALVQSAARLTSTAVGREMARPASRDVEPEAAQPAAASADASAAVEFDGSSLADFSGEERNAGDNASDGASDGASDDASDTAGRETSANRAWESSAQVPAAAPAAASAAPVTRTAPLQGAELSAALADPQVEAENMTRLVESMRVQWRHGVSEATVRLRPEHLGEITISIRVDKGTVSAVIQAESPEVQQWLESQEDRLRSGLSDQGLNLQRFVVQRDPQQDRREQQQQQQRQQAPRWYRPASGDEPRFEVTV